MAERITSISEAFGGRGVFIFFVKVLQAIVALGTGRAVMICRGDTTGLPWGPLDTETPFNSAGAFRDIFSPQGFARTSQAYLMAIRFPWVDLRIVRVLGVGPVKATKTFPDAVPTNILRVDGLYYGAAGNGIVIDIKNATNGVGTSFDLVATITNSLTGEQTQEVYQNVDSTQVADDATHTYWASVTASSKLLGPLVKLAAGRPLNAASVNLISGSDGAAITSAAYLGTPGSADKGVAVLEKDPDVQVVFTDDVGAGLLAAVNAGLKAHQLYMKDRRIVVLQGNAGETIATAKTNAALNKGDHEIYVWPHGYVNDEQGTKTLIPLSGPLAAFMTLLTPHLSIAIKRAEFVSALSAIIDMDGVAQKQDKKDAEAAGVVVFEKNSATGTFSPYDDVCTDTTTPVYQSRMADFIAFSIAERLEDNKGSPNDDETSSEERDKIIGFLEELVSNRKKDHILLPCIMGYLQLPVEAGNTDASEAAGDFFHDSKIQLVPARKRTFLRLQVGTSVSVTPSA